MFLKDNLKISIDKKVFYCVRISAVCQTTKTANYQMIDMHWKVIVSLRRIRRVLFLDLSILFLLFFFSSISSGHFLEIFKQLYSKNIKAID